jgi:adenylate cyclase
MMKFSIRISILQTFAILVILAVVGVSITYYVGSSKISVDLYTRLARTTADKIIERTVNFLEIPGSYTQMIAAAIEETDIIEQHPKIWKLMWHQLRQAPQISSFYVADPQGNFVQTRRNPGLATRIIDRTVSPPKEIWIYRDEKYQIVDTTTASAAYDPRKRPWYKDTAMVKKTSWSDAYIYHSTREPGITGTYPIFDGDGNLTAIVGVDITLRRLTEFVSSQRQRKTSTLFIINERDEAVSGRNLPKNTNPTNEELHLPRAPELRKPWVADAYNKHKMSGQDVLVSTTNGIKYLGVFVNFPDSFDKKWKIAAVVPRAEVTAATRAIIYRAVIIAAVITLACLLLVYVASGLITKPVSMIARDAGMIKGFHLDKVSGVKSYLTEIKLLNDAFIAMKNSLASFKRYVPADLVRQLIATGKEAKLGGEEAHLAIMFTDIVGFAAISESMTAENLMLHLSEYFAHLTSIIQDNHGTIDKYIGDGIMAFWGAPAKVPDASYRACCAALRCQAKLTGLNTKWVADEKPAMPTCIGIHTGETIVGNVGSSDRLNYSIFGDNVNLASRLEGVNRFYGTKVIISRDVYREISDRFICRPLDIVAVKGKTQSIEIYELVAEKDASVSKKITKFHTLFEKGFDAYLKKEWDKALRLFNDLQIANPEDKPVRIYVKRCRALLDNPHTVPDDWDGVMSLTEK